MDFEVVTYLPILTILVKTIKNDLFSKYLLYLSIRLTKINSISTGLNKFIAIFIQHQYYYPKNKCLFNS